MKFGVWVWVLLFGAFVTYMVNKSHQAYTTMAAILTVVLTYLAYKKW